MIYQLYTLVDITATGIYHGDNLLPKHQQQNFNTVIQTIGLFGNIYFTNTPVIIESNKFKGYDKCWFFEWSMEIEDLFKQDNDPIARLPNVFQFVPFIPGLTEVATFTTNAFITNENIMFDYQKQFGLKRLDYTK